MDERLQEEIKQYLKDNLSITCNHDSSSDTVEVVLLLDGERISEDYFWLEGV